MTGNEKRKSSYHTYSQNSNTRTIPSIILHLRGWKPQNECQPQILSGLQVSGTVLHELDMSDLNGAQFPRLKSVTCVLYGLTLTYLNRYRLIEIQMNALSPF